MTVSSVSLKQHSENMKSPLHSCYLKMFNGGIETGVFATYENTHS